MSDASATGTYDYIVVGGGAAGCVTTNRLVDLHGARVLLLEAGGEDNHPLIRMPAGFFKFLNGSPFLTEHVSVSQKNLGGRTVSIWQGNVLGGGSSVNAMVYMRGRPPTMTIGTTSLAAVGATPTCCPISSVRRPISVCTTMPMASTVRSRFPIPCTSRR